MDKPIRIFMNEIYIIKDKIGFSKVVEEAAEYDNKYWIKFSLPIGVAFWEGNRSKINFEKNKTFLFYDSEEYKKIRTFLNSSRGQFLIKRGFFKKEIYFVWVLK